MKNSFFKVSAVALIMVVALSCKNDKENKVETKEAVDKAVSMVETTTYRVNPKSTKIDWEASKITATHTGYINVAKGSIDLNSDNKIVAGEFKLDMSTITVTDLEGDGKANLETHLKGTVAGKEGDFFNINKYPAGVFEITGTQQAEGKTWLEGNLTLLETTKNIKFPINLSLNDNTLVLQSEPFVINRTEWNINYGSESIFPNIGDKVIYDDVQITVYLEASKN